MFTDTEMLARLQFAGTIMFHYIFPPLTIGLGWLMFIMEARYHLTKDKIYEQMARFWTRIFAVNFAMGVATGIVMEFEFGTNWAAYSRYVGDVFGSALAAEGIFAFFLESGFLAVLVFGWDRVSPKMHLFSTLMVAFGATFSAVWITVANSWQQTPAGYHIVGEGLDARAEITSFWEMVFNPSSMHRLNHVIIGAFILASFVVLSICAYYLLRRRHEEFARRCFPIGLAVGLIASVAALVSGHFQAGMVAEHQPAKLAAFEGHYQTSDKGAPLWLLGWPSDVEQRVKYGVGIPGGLSFLVHESFNAPVAALDSFPDDERPPVLVPFMSYHMMVAIGFYCIALSALGLLLYWRGTLFQKRWLLWVFVFSVLGPYIANQAGWIAAEVGRQPWVVQGLLRTSDGLSASVSANQILGSIAMFGFIYTLLFFVWVYVLNDKIQHGPDYEEEHPGKMMQPHGEGYFEAAAMRTDPGGLSMTEAHEERDEK